MISPGSEITANARNLIRAMRFFGSPRKGGDVQDLPGVSLVSCGLNYAAFNAALLSEPPGSDPNFRQVIQTAADHFRSRNLRWTCWFCDDFLDPALLRQARPLFRAFGLSHLTEPVGMLADQLLPPRRRLPKLETRPVDNQPTRLAFAHITSVAFEIPHQVCLDIYGSADAWAGDFQGFVGYVDDLPVTSAATVTAHNVVGVYSVGTLPHCRKRGYAEAAVRQALALQQEQTGITATVLQSTYSGLRLYQQMGYRKVTNFSVFISS